MARQLPVKRPDGDEHARGELHDELAQGRLNLLSQSKQSLEKRPCRSSYIIIRLEFKYGLRFHYEEKRNL